MQSRFTADEFRQAIFAPLNWNGRKNTVLNNLADLPPNDPGAVREVIFKNRNDLLAVGAITGGAFAQNYNSNGKADPTVLSDADALQVRTFARHDRSKIIADHALPFVAKMTDMAVLNSLSQQNLSDQAYLQEVNQHRTKLDLPSRRVKQLTTVHLKQIQLVASVVKSIQQTAQNTQDKTLLQTLAAPNQAGNAPPTAAEMRTRLKTQNLWPFANIQGFDTLAHNNLTGQTVHLLPLMIDTLPDQVLIDLHENAANQAAILTMRNAIEGMQTLNHATLPLLAATAPGGGEPAPNAIRQSLLNNAAQIGGNNPTETARLTTAINRLDEHQLKGLRNLAVAQQRANVTADSIQRIPDPNSNVLRALTENINSYQDIKTALDLHKGVLGGLTQANINQFSNNQLNRIYTQALRQRAYNQFSYEITQKLDRNDVVLHALIAPQGGVDPTLADIKGRLDTQKGQFGANAVFTGTINNLPNHQVEALRDQTIQQLASNQAKYLLSQEQLANSPLLANFTAVGGTGGAPTAIEIKQRMLNANANQLNIRSHFPNLTQGLVDNAITNMPANEATAIYTAALKQLIINQMKLGIEQNNAANDATLQALNVVKQDAALNANQRQTELFNHRAALGINFPAAMNAVVTNAFLALTKAEFDDIYQRASDKRINNNLVNEIGNGISNLSGSVEHNNATLNDIIAAGGAASVPTAAEIKPRLHQEQGNIGFVGGAIPLAHFNALTNPQADGFYRQALKQLSMNKVLHAIEQKLTHNDAALLAFIGCGLAQPPTPAEIKTYLTTHKNDYALNFGADAAVNNEITNAINSMSPQETRDLYIDALKQLVINQVKNHIDQQVTHNDPGLVKLTELTAAGAPAALPVLKDRLFDHRAELGLNFPNTPQMDALREAIGNIPATLYNDAENKLARNKIRHAIGEKHAFNDPTLAGLTALNPDGSRPDFKQKLIAAKGDLGLSSVRDSVIRGLSGPEADLFYEQAGNQEAINTINHHISLKTTHGNAVLAALTISALDADIKTNFIAQKATIGNIDDAIINRLSTGPNGELQALLASAQKQKMVNALHNTITGINNATSPIFDNIVGNPTNDVLEMKRRIKVDKAALNLPNNVPPSNATIESLVDGLSDAQTRGIYQKVLDKRAQLQPYFKLLDSIDATSPLRPVLTDPIVETALKNFLAPPKTPAETADFIEKLTDPSKKKEEIASMLRDEVLLAPASAVTNLSKLLFAENQYKRIFAALDPVLQTEFTTSRTGVINKISEANTPNELDILVKALKESNRSALPAAMSNLGLNPIRANTFYGEREFARLSKELANDPFLQPLLQPNAATITTALTQELTLGSIAQIDAQVKRIKDTDKNQLITELDNLGINRRPDGNALVVDEAFGNKAYHQILHVIGDTIGSEIIANEANVKDALKYVPQADIDVFIKDLKETATRDNVITHINDFFDDPLGLGAAAFDPADTALKNVFAEIQGTRLINAVRKGALKTQMEAQKPQIIEAINRNSALKTPAQTLELLTSLRGSFYEKTDLQNAMGALRLATPPQAVDEVFKENRKIYEELTQKPQTKLTDYQYSQISNNIPSFFAKIDHYHQLTSTAVASKADREIKDLNKLDHLAFRLKEHLLLFNKSLEDIKAKAGRGGLSQKEQQDIEKLIKKIDLYLVKIATIETNLATIHQQIEAKTGPERIAYFSAEKTVDAKVGSADEVRDFIAAYLRGDNPNPGAPQVAAQVNSKTSSVMTTETFGGTTERAIPIIISMKEEDIREKGALATATKKAGIALSSAILNNPTPPKVIRGALHQTYDSAKKEAMTKVELSEDDIKAINRGEKVGYGFRSAKIPNDAAMRIAIDTIESARALNEFSTEPLELKEGKCPQVLEAMVLYCKFMQKNTQLSGYEYTTPYKFEDKFTREHENVLHKRLHDKESGIYDLRHKAVGEKQAAEFKETTASTIRPGGRH